MQKHVGTLKIIITKLNNLPKPFRNTANAVVGAPAIHVYPEPGTEVPLNLTDGPKRATHKENADKKPLKKNLEQTFRAFSEMQGKILYYNPKK